MTIPRIDWFNFLFNGGRGIRTNQLAGAFIKSISRSRVIYQDASDQEQTLLFGRVNNQNVDYTIVAADIGSTIRMTGAAARTFTLPDINDDVPIGSTLPIVNDGTAVLTLDGNGGDTIDGSTTLGVQPGEAITIQAVTASAWDLLSDTTSGEPVAWSTIPLNTPIRVGQIVTHNGGYYGCITNHNRPTLGPDGDAARWILLSNWFGNWRDTWFPIGSLVQRAGFPWVAIQTVVQGDVAPDAATNTKWLRLGTRPPGIVIASSDTTIPETAEGNTYVHTGAGDVTYTLPPASGGSAVRDGWQGVSSNQGSGQLTIDPDGSDTIDGQSSLVLSRGQTIRVQKIADTAWITIADNRGGDAAAARRAADRANARLDEVENVTADFDIVTDGPAFVDAPADEAGHRHLRGNKRHRQWPH